MYSIGLPTFCAAVDSRGGALTYNGSTWSALVHVTGEGLAFSSVSCASASFCVAGAATGYVTQYDGSSWSPIAKIDAATIQSVSCPSVSFCMAVDNSGNALAYNGVTWSTFPGVDGSGLVSVSCPSVLRCVAVDFQGDEVTYSGVPAPEGDRPPSISGATEQGQTLTEVHGEWTNSPTEYSYQWERCASNGEGCTPISGAGSPSYLLAGPDVGHTIRVTETARNDTGAGISAASAATAVIQAQQLGVQEEAAKRKAEEEAAAKRKTEEEAAAKRKTEEEAAARRKHEEEHAATGNIFLDRSVITVERNHEALIKLSCTGTATCRGKLTLTARRKGEGKGKAKNIGTATFSVPANRSETIKLMLNATGRAFLSGAHGRLSAILTIFKGSPSPSKTQTQGVHLVKAKSKK